MEPRDQVLRGVRRLLGVLALGAWGLAALTHGAAIVAGSSMEPALSAGDVVLYRRGSAGVAVGDLVVFDHPEWSGGVVHRVTQVCRDGTLRTRGDANRTNDRDPVARERVRGVAVLVLPSGRLVAAAWGGPE